MRFIRTFVLHIYVDTEVPEQLCGNIRSLEETGIVPFKNPKELEAQLRRLIQNPSSQSRINPIGNAEQPDEKEVK